MSGIGLIILCGLFIAFVFVILQSMRATKIPPKQSIVAWVGTLGSGKTYLPFVTAKSISQARN